MTIRTGAAQVLREAPGLLLMLPVWVWWALDEGGYPPAVWLAGLVYLCGVAGVLILAVPPVRPGRPAAIALIALASLSGWTLLSITWAPDAGSALLGGLRTVLYCGSFAIALLWPATARGAVLAASLWTLAVVIAIAVGLSESGAAGGGFAVSGRLTEPTGYVNASGALFGMAAVVAMLLAADPARAPGLRVAACAVAVPLAAAMLLAQSRGALAATVATLAAAIATSPHRWRLAFLAGLVAGVLLATYQPVLDVRTTALANRTGDAVDDAAWLLTALLVAGIGVGLASLGLGVVRARRPLGSRGRRVRRGAVAAMLAVTVAVLAVAVGDPVQWASDRVTDFRTPDYDRLERSDSRFSGDLGSNRADYWRVALHVVRTKPLTGSGAVNFAAPYLRLRRTDKAPLYTHNVWLQTASDLGVPGLVALLAFAIAAAVAAAGAWRAADVAGRVTVTLCSAPLILLAVHASADWVSFFPALAAPALAFGATACALPVVDRRTVRRLPAIAVVVPAALALVSVPPWAAARLADDAAQSWRTDPVGAGAELRRAQDLNPLSSRAPLVRGIQAIELGNRAEAAAAFRVANERDPSYWYPWFAIGLLAAADGDRAAALRAFAAAQERNPREPAIARVVREVRDGGVVDPARIQREVSSRPG